MSAARTPGGGEGRHSRLVEIVRETTSVPWDEARERRVLLSAVQARAARGRNRTRARMAFAGAVSVAFFSLTLRALGRGEADRAVSVDVGNHDGEIDIGVSPIGIRMAFADGAIGDGGYEGAAPR